MISTLYDRKTVYTQAIFWKIIHNHEDTEDICLKLGRYKKSKSWQDAGKQILESEDPKSELTLIHEEFLALVKFIQDNYEPFRKGVKSFISLDNQFTEEMAKQVRSLFNVEDTQSAIQFIVDNHIISSELEIGLRNAKRTRAVTQFENMLADNLTEPKWQNWFEENSWVLGTEFVELLDHRVIDPENISDFLLKAYDGFVDIVEIKRPEGLQEFWMPKKDHENWVPSSDLMKAVTQASKYIYEIERESNSIKFYNRIGQVPVVKPRGILIYGRSQNWDEEKRVSYRILNSNFSNITVLTYDHVLERAKRVIGLTI